VSAKPEAAEGEKKPVAKNKKMLIIIVAALVLVLGGGGGAFFYISKQRAAAAEDGGEEAAPGKTAAQEAHKGPPTYLPLDNMVVNLADPGGERVAQIGLTLVLLDAKATETVKGYMPTIRSGILMLISQRTAEVLLSAEGKEALAKDILREAAVPFGGGEEEEENPNLKKTKKKAAPVEYPVTGVLFSSFIVQ
jgi:flagellar FliL protein